MGVGLGLVAGRCVGLRGIGDGAVAVVLLKGCHPHAQVGLSLLPLLLLQAGQAR